jgi:hypothetical protein
MSPGELWAEEIKQIFPNIPNVRDPVANALGTSYQFLLNLEKDHVQFPFWLAVFLLGMTGISWFLHLSMRGAQRSAPLPLARQDPEKTPAGNPRGASFGKDSPIVVQPIDD